MLLFLKVYHSIIECSWILLQFSWFFNWLNVSFLLLSFTSFASLLQKHFTNLFIIEIEEHTATINKMAEKCQQQTYNWILNVWNQCYLFFIAQIHKIQSKCFIISYLNFGACNIDIKKRLQELFLFLLIKW